MHDCCRSRKGFGLEERHGINDTTTIREGLFPNKSTYGRPPELSCVPLSPTGVGVCRRVYRAAPGPPLVDRVWRAADNSSRHQTARALRWPLLYQLVQIHTRARHIG